jgi:hypothetical protein
VIIPGSHINSERVLKLKPTRTPTEKPKRKTKKTTVPVINLNTADNEEESDN